MKAMTKAQIVAQLLSDLDTWSWTTALWSWEIDRAPDFRSKEACRIAYDRVSMRLNAVEYAARNIVPNPEITVTILSARERFRNGLKNGTVSSIFDDRHFGYKDRLAGELRELDARITRYNAG